MCCAQQALRLMRSLVIVNKLCLWIFYQTAYIEYIYCSVVCVLLAGLTTHSGFAIVDFIVIACDGAQRRTQSTIADWKYCKSDDVGRYILSGAGLVDSCWMEKDNPWASPEVVVNGKKRSRSCTKSIDPSGDG